MTRISQNDDLFKKHLREEHGISSVSEYIREIVYGGVDGIVTTFAVVAGFAGATNAQEIDTVIPVAVVLLFGLANLFGDASSMALGNFLSVRADHDLYFSHRKKELYEIRHSTEMEKAETMLLFKHQGFTQNQAKKLTDIYKTNKEAWADLMMSNELSLDNPENTNPYITSLATFVSFIVFGFIPLIPYTFFSTSHNLFIYSIVFAAFALILLGFVRKTITQSNIIRSIGEILLLGSVAATIAYFVGTFFA